jgi:hypothetical protein
MIYISMVSTTKLINFVFKSLCRFPHVTFLRVTSPNCDHHIFSCELCQVVFINPNSHA